MTVFDLRIVVARLEGELRSSLEQAVARAVSRSNGLVEIEHWLAELLQPNAPPARLLAALDVPRDRVADEVATALDRLDGGHAGAPALSRSLLEWVEEAWLTASLRFGRNSIATADLLVALTTSSTLQRAVRDIAPSLRFQEGQAMELAAAVKPEASPTLPGAQDARPAASADQSELERYTLDVTAQARAGRLDPVVGREAELRQVVDILMRRRQNNPILTGEAGVGKTAVVEALALRIAEGTVPEKLRGVVLRSLDLGLLQAGAGVKGEFERRLTGVIAGIKSAPHPVILFIDEAHTMIGAGNQPGASDAANLLKPALARGELRTIAATTWSEYKRHIERDPALTRRFQVVKIGEPEIEVAVRMLRGLVPSLEAHHGVVIHEEALRDAVRLSARYLPDRQLPDKAISVLDTASANVAMSRSTDPAAIEQLEAEHRALKIEHDRLQREHESEVEPRREAVEQGLVETSAQLERMRARLGQEREVIGRIDGSQGQAALDKSLLREELAALQGDEPLVYRAVDREAVAAVIARWTGVPLGRLLRDSISSALSLEDRLRERVVGQDQALAIVAAAMRNAAAQLSDPRKPPAVFLFVGTSGVGKTETALALADQFYGGSQHLSVINLSEFKEEHKVSSLVGAPPGYVGYGEGGVLTEAVRRRPYGLLLLDEVEKAHPGVQDIFYQVFDKGILRDGEGRDIEFHNTTIILTSNAGAETLAALAIDPETMPEGDRLVDTLRPELLRHFKPAFLGRVTVVPYLPLSDATLRGIVQLQLARVRDRLWAVHKATLEVGDTVEDRIAERCLTGDIGARAVEGIISREILPRISDLILDHAVRKAAVTQIRIFVDDQNCFQVRAVDEETASYRRGAAAGRDRTGDHTISEVVPAQTH